MLHLILASLLWAFSFGLIKRYLPGLDPWWVAGLRLLLAALAFAPWWRRWSGSGRQRGQALALGAVQFGLMYVCYLSAFRFLAAWQVALWTVFTPVLVVLMAQLGRAAIPADGLAGGDPGRGRGPSWRRGGCRWARPCAGCCWCRPATWPSRPVSCCTGPWRGAAAPGDAASEAGLIGWMSLGGALLPVAMALVLRRPLDLDLAVASAPVLLYLGLLPTAVGFWLWNRGAAR